MTGRDLLERLQAIPDHRLDDEIAIASFRKNSSDDRDWFETPMAFERLKVETGKLSIVPVGPVICKPDKPKNWETWKLLEGLNEEIARAATK